MPIIRVTIVSMSKRAITAFSALTLLACGDDAASAVAELLADAGELIQDAGTALVDAGEALGSDGSAKAQVADGGSEVPAPARRTLEAACDIQRVAWTVSATEPEAQRHLFARFAVADLAEVRSVWGCGATAPTCPREHCDPSPIPAKWECVAADQRAAFADGQLWVQCSGFTTVRVVVD